MSFKKIIQFTAKKTKSYFHSSIHALKNVSETIRSVQSIMCSEKSYNIQG